MHPVRYIITAAAMLAIWLIPRLIGVPWPPPIGLALVVGAVAAMALVYRRVAEPDSRRGGGGVMEADKLDEIRVLSAALMDNLTPAHVLELVTGMESAFRTIDLLTAEVERLNAENTGARLAVTPLVVAVNRFVHGWAEADHIVRSSLWRAMAKASDTAADRYDVYPLASEQPAEGA